MSSNIEIQDAGPVESLVVLPQPQWEGLDWKNRKLVLEHAKQTGVNLVTGECDTDESNTGGIRAEVFEG